jgi:Na+/melibiose symporter-like transporter
LFLKDKALAFLRKIGFVCLIGSLILVPFIVSALAKWSDRGEFFFASLVAAVLAMIFAYYRSVRSLQLALYWWFLWLICLAIAITLQLTVVFHYL